MLSASVILHLIETLFISPELHSGTVLEIDVSRGRQNDLPEVRY
jgi:hypothetical protein